MYPTKKRCSSWPVIYGFRKAKITAAADARRTWPFYFDGVQRDNKKEERKQRNRLGPNFCSKIESNPPTMLANFISGDGRGGGRETREEEEEKPNRL